MERRTVHSQPQSKIFSRLQYLWRLAVPLWMFRDASRGTLGQRAANYRHNRSRRHILPFYIAKWIGIAACLLFLARTLSAMMLTAAQASASHICATLACMSVAIGFAFSCVVVAVLLAGYLFLTYVKQ